MANGHTPSPNSLGGIPTSTTDGGNRNETQGDEVTNDEAITDLTLAVSYLMQQKTPPLHIGEAMNRLRDRAKLVKNQNAGSIIDYVRKV